MSNISIRKLDDDVVRLLRIRAATKGLSMEEEIRRILKDSVSAPERIGDLAVKTFGESHGIELPANQYSGHEPIEFQE